MTADLRAHARITADASQLKGEARDGAKAIDDLGKAVKESGDKARKSDGDWAALRQELNGYKADLAKLKTDHAATTQQLAATTAELAKMRTGYAATTQQMTTSSAALTKVRMATTEVNAASGALANGGLRQMSMQFSQVAQQGVATGNFLQALMIQIPDLALGFGTAGVAIGALIPIAFALGQGLLDLDGKAVDAGESVGEFVDAVSVIRNYVDTARTSVGDLREEFGGFARDVQRASALAAQAAVSLAFDKFDAAAQGVRANLNDVVAAIDDIALKQRNVFQAQDLAKIGLAGAADVQTYKDALDIATDAASDLLTAIGMSTAEAVDLNAALEALASAQGMAEVAAASARALDLLRGMYDTSEKIPAPIAEMIRHLEDMLRAASSGVAAMEDIEGATGGAANEAARLAGNILTAANNAISFQQAMSSLSIPFADAMADLDFELSTAGMNATDKLVATRMKRLEDGMRAASKRTFGFDYGLTDDQKADLAAYEAAIRKSAPKLTAGSRSSGGTGKGGGRSGRSSTKQEADDVQQLIAAKTDELAILRETDPVQQEMLRLREKLIEATPKERMAVEALITTYEREKTAKAQAQQSSDFLQSSAADLIPSLVRGGDQAASAWQRFVKVLEDAAWQAVLLGEGPLAKLTGGLFGGGKSSGGLLSFIPKLLGLADGGDPFSPTGMIYGSGGPREDKKMILVSPGETIVNARATSRHRALLEAINSNAPLPRFAQGGSIGGGSASRSDAVLNLVVNNNTGSQITAHDDGRDAQGRRAIRFELAEAVGTGMAVRGGAASRQMRQLGIKDRGPRRG